MQITLTWDPSVATMSPGERSAFEGAVTYAADYFDRVLTSNLDITINVGWGEITQAGQSSTVSPGTGEGGPDDLQLYTYTQVRSALLAHKTSPQTAAAYSALPTVDPTAGQGYYVSELEAQALGLQMGQSGALGSVGFGVDNVSIPYNFSTTGRAVAGESDFVAIAEHEIAHALGRVSGFGFGPQGSILDLFRFTSAGTLATNGDQPAYFSINGGVTALENFASTASDPADWSPSGAFASLADSFNAVATAGLENFVTSTDLNVMNLLGYAVTPDLPGDDFNGHQVSDLLIRNTAGAVVVGEAASGGPAAYAQVGALGPEWKFVGTGDFLGDRRSDFLIENTSGSVVVGEVDPLSGHATYTQVGALGPEWKFVGAGNFLGDGLSDFLIQNTAGAVTVGEVVSGHAQYTQVGALGPEWKFVGAGDFLGDGKADFLIGNTAGAVVVGEVVNGHAQYTAVGALGSEWKFVETGDFLGDGKSDFLIRNSAGAVVVGEVTNGHAAYTQVGGLGAEWSFVGAGDYAGTGVDSFLIENTRGAIFTGTVVGGHAQYAQVGALGPEWTFHG
jgi:hypothetical protein